MVLKGESNLPNQTVIETRWLSLVNDIHQLHNELITLIETCEQNPSISPKAVFKLTCLQQHVLDTLSKLLAESMVEGEVIALSKLSERLQQKHNHSQVLIQLKRQVDLELGNLRLG
ncbi:hypothetical protein GCM10027347_48820 [Larkinella harenae]